MFPYDRVGALFPSVALLETVTPLGNGGAIQTDQFDTIDLLRRFQTSTGLSVGTAYTRDPESADPRYVIHYIVGVNFTGLEAIAPGEIVMNAGVVDPSTGNISANISIPVIPVGGSPARFTDNLGGTNRNWIEGSVSLRYRFFSIGYFNGATAQTTFNFGAYWRPTH